MANSVNYQHFKTLLNVHEKSIFGKEKECLSKWCCRILENYEKIWSEE